MVTCLLCLQFAISGSRKKWCLQHFCLIKKWMMLKIVDKSVLKIIALPNNLVLVCRFQGHNLTLYDSWKLQLESWNTNHKPLNWTLGDNFSWNINFNQSQTVEWSISNIFKEKQPCMFKSYCVQKPYLSKATVAN